MTNLARVLVLMGWQATPFVRNRGVGRETRLR